MKIIGTILSIAFPIILIGLFIGQILLSNELAGTSSIVASLDREIIVYTDKNMDLKQKIASESSLAVISHKAKATGFTEVKKVLTIPSDYMTVALNTSK